jgi:hypothetical protein
MLAYPSVCPSSVKATLPVGAWPVTVAGGAGLALVVKATLAP